MADKSSITVAMSLRNTIACTATHPSSSSGVTVGALRPGVMLDARTRSWRETLYVQRTYFCAVITPLIRLAMISTSFGSEGCLERIRIAVDSITVAIGFRPAARIVSPDSVIVSEVIASE